MSLAGTSKHTDEDQPSQELAAFYWDWNKHEDDVFTNRGSFFLVGQSMLLAAAAGLMAAGRPKLNAAILVFCFTGLVLTVVQVVVSTRHLETQQVIKQYLRLHEPRWALVYDQRSQSPRSATMIGVVVPVVVLTCWLALALLVAADLTG